MTTGPADFVVAGKIRVRVTGDRAGIDAVRRQLGVERGDAVGDADIVIEVVDQVPSMGSLRRLGPDAGYTDDGFFVTRGQAKSKVMVRIPFGEIGGSCTITCQRGLPAVPLLVPILCVTALGRGLVPLHAGAFSWGGTGIVVTGWEKGGKTECLIAAAELGAGYVGDEWCFIDPERCEVVGLPEPVTIWAWHARFFPPLARSLPLWTRWKLAALEGPERLEARLPDGARRGRCGSLLRRVTHLVSSRARIALTPAELFGTATADPMPLDRIVLVASVDRPAVELRPIQPEQIAAPMVHSVVHELGPLLDTYRMFRFAHPTRTCPSLDRLETDLSDGLHRALSGVRAYVLEHPSPVDLAELGAALIEMRACEEP